MLPPNDNAPSQSSSTAIRYARFHALLTRWRPRAPRSKTKIIDLERANVLVSRRLLVSIIGLLWQMGMELERTGGNPTIIRRGIALREQLEQAIGYRTVTRQLDVPIDISGRDHQ